MTSDAPPPPVSRRTRSGRLLSAFALALVIAFSVYLLLTLSKAGSPWIASLWFLALLPAVLSALICYIGDPDQDRPDAFFWFVPMVLVGVVDATSGLFLREGVICLIMLSPIWLVSGWIGALLLRSLRRRMRSRNTLNSSFLVIPLVAAMVEAQVPIPHEQVLLTRSVMVRASPQEIWPYAVSNPSISPREGRWTITHNIIGLPRPRATLMHGMGVGAVRAAYWGDHINFEEDITDWAPGRKLGWRFAFNNRSMQDYTDQHISPDGLFLKIDSGDYTLRPVSPGLTELTLNTRYIAKTHANLYARLWGEFLMGDTEENILTILKNRAEAAHARHARLSAAAGTG
ncbi:MAG: SRPBCC family protein [Caulobacteraceae bacterium]|nr:SRPBCC family protein [Caulobacteraceae bacterium]